MRHRLKMGLLTASIGWLAQGPALAQSSPPQPVMIAPQDAPSRITIPPKGELGDKLIVDGTVTGPDGKTPIKGASVYVYHTDASGHYEPGETEPSNNPRLKGYMRTDARGRYHFSTIRPAAYPNRTIPAHIHYLVVMPGHARKGFELQFSDDRLLTDQIRTQAAKPDGGISICEPRRDKQGRWHCAQNIALRPF